MMRANWMGWLILAFVWAPTGCTALSGLSGGAAAGDLATPAWIERGSALVTESDDRYFAGVGAARDRLRVPLLKKVAQRKAKEAIREPINTYLQALAGPWLGTLDAKTKKEMKPTRMLDKLLGRVAKLAAIDEVYVPDDGEVVFAMSRIDLMAVLMEIEASPDTEPLRAYLAGAGIDPTALFDQVAAGGVNQQQPPDEAPAPETDK
ncbi:hypothetical protein ACFL6C_13850 [Myxococcota bacterium]